MDTKCAILSLWIVSLHRPQLFCTKLDLYIFILFCSRTPREWVHWIRLSLLAFCCNKYYNNSYHVFSTLMSLVSCDLLSKLNSYFRLEVYFVVYIEPYLCFISCSPYWNDVAPSSFEQRVRTNIDIAKRLLKDKRTICYCYVDLLIKVQNDDHHPFLLAIFLSICFLSVHGSYSYICLTFDYN